MAGYGIFRVAKLKTMGNLQGSLKHAFREQITLNADPSRTAHNELLTPDTPDTASVMAKYEALKPEKIRNDQVRALEVLITASPEDMQAMTPEQKREFFERSLKFANDEFGEGNLLHAQIHNDETTAHLTAFYIPLVEKQGKKGSKITLNAKELLGGRAEYSQRQNRFYERVSHDFGLERGEVGSKAHHKKISDYYRDVHKYGDDLKDAVEYMESLERQIHKLEHQLKIFKMYQEGYAESLVNIAEGLGSYVSPRNQEKFSDFANRVKQGDVAFEDVKNFVEERMIEGWNELSRLNYQVDLLTTQVEELEEEKKAQEMEKKLNPVMTPKIGGGFKPSF